MSLFPDPDPPEPAPPPAPEATAPLEPLTDPDILAWLRRGLVKIFRFRIEYVGRSNANVTPQDARRLLHHRRKKWDADSAITQMLAPPEWRFVGFQVGTEVGAFAYTGNLLDGGEYAKEPPVVPKRSAE